MYLCKNGDKRDVFNKTFAKFRKDFAYFNIYVHISDNSYFIFLPFVSMLTSFRIFESRLAGRERSRRWPYSFYWELSRQRTCDISQWSRSRPRVHHIRLKYQNTHRHFRTNNKPYKENTGASLLPVCAGGVSTQSQLSFSTSD